jgi:(R,R)-butanediol dehydrogenase / meso-butanediol dehydrogenase / diacetyl reductase
MKALRWYAAEDLRYEDVPEPEPDRGEVKIRVTCAGICGTDLREYAVGPYMIPKGLSPITLGHEFTGTVAAVGEGVTGFTPGDRVTALGYRFCGECYCCRRMNYNICCDQGFSGLTVDGSMADYMTTPEYTCFRVPDAVSDEWACLTEPLSVAIHAVKRGGVRPGDTVAVIGDGAIGLCIVLAARAAGATAVHVVSRHRKRAEKALALKAASAVDSDDNPVSAIQEMTAGIGADVSFESAGNTQAAQTAVDVLRRGGTAVIVGLFDKPGIFHFGDIVLGEKNIVGSSIYIREAEAALAMMADKRIVPDGLITSIIPMGVNAAEIFDRQLNDKDNNLKTLFLMDR